jgi:hypothetical protein
MANSSTNVPELSRSLQTTVVTAYFQLKTSKASDATYKQWMKNMLEIDNQMVIFCDEQSVGDISENRKHKMDKTKIIVMSFTDFYCYRYIDAFRKDYLRDAESIRGHTVELYMIWNEKTHFLKRAIEMNPFQTSHFVWTDIGCFRVPNTRYIHWPNPDKILACPQDKVWMLLVKPFTMDELLINNVEQLPHFDERYYRIGGTIFGGRSDALLNLHKMYYGMIEYFISKNKSIAKDQNVMNSVYLLNRDKCLLVVPQDNPYNRDIWFYMQEFLHH